MKNLIVLLSDKSVAWVEALQEFHGRKALTTLEKWMSFGSIENVHFLSYHFTVKTAEQQTS